MSRIVQLELELEEMQQRVSKLEKLFTDLSKWTDFQKELEEGDDIEIGNDQDIELSYKIDIDESEEDVINEFKIDIERKEDENSGIKNNLDSDPSEHLQFEIENSFKEVGFYESLIITPLQPSVLPIVALKKLQNEEMPLSKSFLSSANAKSEQIIQPKNVKQMVKKPEKCYFCKKNFANLNRHFAVHTGENPSKRPSAVNQTTINEQFETSRSKTAFKCPHCSYTARTKSTLEYHNQRVHPKNEDRPFISKVCEKTSRFKRNLQRHKTNIDTDTSCLCHYCPYVAKTNCSLNSHIKLMHEKKLSDYFKCYFCKYKSKYWSHLRKQVSQHTGECAYKCPTCPYETGDPSGLLHHVNVVHTQNTKGRTFKCTECPAKFVFQKYLDKHMKWHGKNDSRKCNFCPNLPKFVSVNMLNIHKRKEHPTGQRNYKCPHCPKMFKEPYKLEEHVNSHTGLKPYECPKCSYSCAQQSNLGKHVRRCKVKGREVEQNVLVECDECNQKFTNEGNVKRHKARWHPKNVLNCPDCNHIFRDKLKLQTHIAKRHGGSASDQITEQSSPSLENVDVTTELNN